MVYQLLLNIKFTSYKYWYKFILRLWHSTGSDAFEWKWIELYPNKHSHFIVFIPGMEYSPLLFFNIVLRSEYVFYLSFPIKSALRHEVQQKRILCGCKKHSSLCNMHYRPLKGFAGKWFRVTRVTIEEYVYPFFYSLQFK